jgi:alkanesulfonate monooxygenase SsuD/methylene tetrahydromethanopterin reductase-like flavin-dependent oxidoreductase (luciferase family)
VRYGLALPDGGECGDPTFLAELAQRAEDAGWDGVFLEDYILWQGRRDFPTCDVWVALGAIAASTEKVRLGTAVTPLARRRPWKVAREAAAVDQLSGGRMILGVGLGDIGDAILQDSSFSAFGEVADGRRRGEMLDEALDIIAGLWTAEPFSYAGRHFTIDEVTFTPPPVQRPRIPIWIGGGYPNRRPTERALRWDGSCLYKETHGGPWEDMSPDDIRDLRRRAGNKNFDICVGGRDREEDVDAERAWIAAVAEAGADWWSEYVPPADRDAMRAAVDRGPLRAAF